MKTEFVHISVLLFVTCQLFVGCVDVNHTYDPNKTDMVDKQSAARARLTLGLAYLNEGDIVQAQQNLTQALLYSGNDYQVLQGMALYQHYIGEYNTAVFYYKQALKQNAIDAGILNNYGTLLCQLGQYEEAQKQYNNAINTQDYRYLADSLENSGYCYLQCGDRINAQRTLLQALSKAPSKGENTLLTAERYMKQQHYQDAQLLLDIYEKVLPLNANSVWLQLRLAIVEQQPEKITYYRDQLATHFPQSEQYRQFLTNEY